MSCLLKENRLNPYSRGGGMGTFERFERFEGGPEGGRAVRGGYVGCCLMKKMDDRIKGLYRV